MREIIRIARERHCRVQLISAGDKARAAEDYKIALRKHRPEAWNILLLDSDEVDSGSLSIDFCQRNNIERQHAQSVFWMVQLMEAWFLADKEALAGYYGVGFRLSALRHNPDVEKVSKQDVYAGLKSATRDTSKGEYHKTKHAPDLLGLVSPEQVKNAAPNCRRMFESMLGVLTA